MSFRVGHLAIAKRIRELERRADQRDAAPVPDVIVLIGGLPEPGAQPGRALAWSIPGERSWLQGPFEGLAAFRERVLQAGTVAGAKHVIFAGLPPKDAPAPVSLAARPHRLAPRGD
jgi:hypothetical protein